MAVKAISVSTTGLVPNTVGFGLGLTQQTPTVIYITTNDTLATVTTTGYLNTVAHDFDVTFNNYQMALVYTTDNRDVWLTVSVTGSGAAKVYSLVAIAEPGAITTPTITNELVHATNTLGTLATTAANVKLTNGSLTLILGSLNITTGNIVLADGSVTCTTAITCSAGNIQAGSSGNAGNFKTYPAGAASGYLALIGVANAGVYGVNISNVSYGQSSTISFADVGSSAGRFLVANTATPFTSGNLVKASGTGGLMVDASIVAANVVVNTGTTTMAAASKIILDKGTGTEAANAVTISKQSGVITTSGLTAAGGATYVITLTNTLIATTSVVQLSWMGGTNTTANFTMSATAGSGSSVITIYNNTAATALNGTIIIGFTVF